MLLFLIPAVPAAFATTIQVTGVTPSLGETTATSCLVGTCPNPADTIGNSIQPGQTANGSFSAVYTLKDGDQYDITGTYLNTFSANGNNLKVQYLPQVQFSGTYIGNVFKGATVAVAADTLDFSMFQTFYDTVTGWNGCYSQSFDFTTLSPGVGASAQLLWDQQAVGAPLTATGPVTTNPTTACNQMTFTNAQNASTFFDAQFNVDFTFQAGVAPGTGAVSVAAPSSVPEPATAGMLLFSSVAGGLFLLRRKSSL